MPIVSLEFQNCILRYNKANIFSLNFYFLQGEKKENKSQTSIYFVLLKLVNHVTTHSVTQARNLEIILESLIFISPSTSHFQDWYSIISILLLVSWFLHFFYHNYSLVYILVIAVCLVTNISPPGNDCGHDCFVEHHNLECEHQEVSYVLISLKWLRESWYFLKLEIVFWSGNVTGLVGNWKKVAQMVEVKEWRDGELHSFWQRSSNDALEILLSLSWKNIFFCL